VNYKCNKTKSENEDTYTNYLVEVMNDKHVLLSGIRVLSDDFDYEHDEVKLTALCLIANKPTWVHNEMNTRNYSEHWN